jgi:hypothetical protein
MVKLYMSNFSIEYKKVAVYCTATFNFLPVPRAVKAGLLFSK